MANQTRSTDTGVCTYTAVGAEFDPTATGDNCSIASVTNDFNGSATLAGAVFPIGATTVLWTITDDCGNSQNCSFVVTVIDNELPVIVCPSDLTDIPADPGECYATGVILGAPVTSDNCGVFTVTNNAPAQFPSGTTIVIWTVTDIHGNIATCNQNVTVIDTEFPTFTAPPAIIIYKDASCGYNADVTVTGDVTDEADNCDTSLDATFTDTVVDGSCEGEQIITRTWTLSDNYGNTTTHDQIITVEDTTAPTWTTAANALDVTLECSDAAGLAAAQLLIPVATDNCDPDVTDIVKVTGVYVPGAVCPEAGSYTNTWTVTDACGNESATYTQTITIIDTTAPTWTTAANALDVTLECSDAAGLAAAQLLIPVATDNCDPDVTDIVKVTGVYVPGAVCPEAGSYTNTWTVTDACGNESATYTQTITIIDTTAPTWTTSANALDVTLECSDAAGLAAAQLLIPVATDNCDPDVTDIVKVTGVYVPGAVCPEAGSYTNTWTVTDACGNESATYTQTITIIDTTAPTWTTAANALDVTLECSDAAGLAAAQLLIPVATDNCDPDVTDIVKVTGVYVPGAVCPEAGSYTNTWTVTDACGNESATYTQTITIIDTTAPTWTTSANALDVTLECSDAAGLAAAQLLIPVATDNCDPDVTDIVKVTGVYVPGAVCPEAGSYTNTWTVTDACGNESATYTQTITIIDTTAPTWTTAANALDVTLECSDAAGLAAAQLLIPVATDNCDPDVTDIVKVTGVYVPGAVCPEAGSYTNTWTVTDACGNESATYTQTITIIDTTAPTWTTAANALDVTLECSDAAGLAAAQLLIPVATDNCDPDVTDIVKVTGVYVPGAVCPEAGSYTNTWTVTDACGNESATYTQTITIIDTTAPTWTTAANALDVTLECSDAAGLAAAQLLIPVATDNCDPDVTDIVKVTGVYVPGAVCPEAGSYTNTWTVTDACGNESATYTQTITIIDTTAPTWTTAANALDVTLECSDAAGLAAAQLLIPVATDNCDPDVTDIVKVTGVYVPGAVCPEAGSYTNTWTVTDACGNESATYTQTITIIDTTAPTWTTSANALDVTLECSDAAGLAAAQLLIPVATDNCDPDVTDIVKVTGVYVPGAVCPEAGSYTNTWTVTDACGNVECYVHTDDHYHRHYGTDVDNIS